MGIDAWGWDRPLQSAGGRRARARRAGHLLGSPPVRSALLADRAARSILAQLPRSGLHRRLLPAAARRRAAPRPRASSRSSTDMPRIDLHAHVIPDEYRVAASERCPTDLPTRFRRGLDGLVDELMARLRDRCSGHLHWPTGASGSATRPGETSLHGWRTSASRSDRARGSEPLRRTRACCRYPTSTPSLAELRPRPRRPGTRRRGAVLECRRRLPRRPALGRALRRARPPWRLRVPPPVDGAVPVAASRHGRSGSTSSRSTRPARSSTSSTPARSSAVRAFASRWLISAEPRRFWRTGSRRSPIASPSLAERAPAGALGSTCGGCTTTPGSRTTAIALARH